MNARAFSAGVAAWSASLLLAAPNFRILADPVTYPQRYELFQLQVADPFVRSTGVWDGDFMAYRILVPAIAHGLGLPALAGVALIWLAGLALLSVLFAVVERRTTTRTAWLVTIGLALTPLIEGSHVYIGYPDAVGWLLAALLLVWRSPIAWAAATFAMMFNDERGVLALPLVLGVALYDRRHDPGALRREGTIAGVAIAVGLAAALAARWAIATGAIGGAPLREGIFSSGAGFDTVTTAHLAGLLLALKVFWVLPVWAAAFAARERGAARVYWLALAICAVTAVALSARVFDFWRSLALLFPLVLLAVVVLHQQRPAALQRVLPVLTLLMIVLPQLEQMNRSIRWLRPLPLAIYEWQTGRSLADLLRQWL